MTDLDRLYKDGEDTWNYNQTFLRIANETLQGKNLQKNYGDVVGAIDEANERIDHIKKEGRNAESFELLRNELLILRDNIYERIITLQ